MNDLIELYSVPIRQKVITLLSMYEPGDVVTVRHLARIISAAKNDMEVQNVGSGDYRSTYNSLTTLHLDEFQDNGVIEYDEDRKTVEVTRRTMEAAADYMKMKAVLR